jgi:hypothetical protein
MPGFRPIEASKTAVCYVRNYVDSRRRSNVSNAQIAVTH